MVMQMQKLSVAILAGATFFSSLPLVALTPDPALEGANSIVIQRERPTCAPLTPEQEESLLDFTEAESLAAIARFGCDCPRHIATIRCSGLARDLGKGQINP
ncbi:MAG: hypothetical protein HC919_04310 [Oscillatoriales cyanobacterium SM2_2_1]|nr:hypothetical protein [Oscillatoriales cyanobacterium SM2_2_1]